MPPKAQPQAPNKAAPKKYSLAAKFYLFGIPLIGLANIVTLLLTQANDDKESEKAGMINTYIPLSHTALYPLIVTTAAIINYVSQNTQNTTNGDACLTTLPYDNKFPNDNPTDILDCTTPEHLKRLKAQGHAIDAQFALQNTFLHYRVINHNYRIARTLFLSLSPEEKKRISIAKDANGRTALHLGLAIAAPGKMQRLLMTPENVMLADAEGVTPLMLAASGFTNSETTQHLLHMIGKKRLAQALAAKDKQGRSVYDYGNLSKQTIMANLQDLIIDPNKAHNHCFNSFNREERPICAQTKEDKKLLGSIFDLGRTQFRGEPAMCVTATQKNLETFRSLPYTNQPLYEKFKQTMNDGFFSDYNANSKSQIWDIYGYDAKFLLDKGISNVSLIDEVMNRRTDNLNLIKTSASNTPK